MKESEFLSDTSAKARRLLLIFHSTQSACAIALLIAKGEPVHVVVHEGTRHDLGNPGGYLKAAVDFALDRDDYGPELREWLEQRLSQ